MYIRTAVDADIPAMHRIRTSVRENRLADPAKVRPADYRSMLERRGRGWVAECGGGPVGFAIADLTDASIWALVVDPAFEGRGAGRTLHDAMLAWLSSVGAERVWLSTEPGARAERFYAAASRRYAGASQGESRCELDVREWCARLGSPHGA